MSRYGGNGREHFQVTYANVDTETFPVVFAVDVVPASGVLLLRNGGYDRGVISTLPMAPLRKWEWVKAP